MTQKLFSILAALLVATVTANAAQAACFAEYKAKRDNPFALFYEVAEISGPCTVDNATAQLSAALAGQGLILLKVLSVREG